MNETKSPTAAAIALLLIHSPCLQTTFCCGSSAQRSSLENILRMSTDYKFEGWVGLDANAAKGNMVWQSYEPKAFQETDIDVWSNP